MGITIIWPLGLAVLAFVMAYRQFTHKGEPWLNKYEADLFEDKDEAYKYAGTRAIYGGIMGIVLALCNFLDSERAFALGFIVFVVAFLHTVVFWNMRKK